MLGIVLVSTVRREYRAIVIAMFKAGTVQWRSEAGIVRRRRRYVVIAVLKAGTSRDHVEVEDR